MNNTKQAVITIVTLTITFIIPITVTSAIQNSTTDVRTRAQEITAQAANTVNTGFTQLSNTPSINLPIVGEITTAVLGLFAIAIFFLILTILAGINLVKSRRTPLE